MKDIGKDPFTELAEDTHDTLIQTEKLLKDADRYHRVIHGALCNVMQSIEVGQVSVDIAATIDMLSELFSMIKEQNIDIKHCIAGWQEAGIIMEEITTPKIDEQQNEETIH